MASLNDKRIVNARRALEKDPSPENHANLGALLYNSIKRSDNKESFEHLRIGAENDVPIAVEHLADAYYNGKGVEKDIAKGIELYEKAADLGSIEAAFAAGNENMAGTHIEANYEKAFKYFTMAEMKSESAMNGLGIMYLCGFHVEKDYAKAHAYFKKAANRGNPVSRKNLKMLEDYGPEFDYRSAFLEEFKSSE